MMTRRLGDLETGKSAGSGNRILITDYLASHPYPLSDKCIMKEYPDLCYPAGLER
jgi:hypothetical protein